MTALTMPFGKLKDRPLEEVPLSYLMRLAVSPRFKRECPYHWKRALRLVIEGLTQMELTGEIDPCQ